MCFNWNDGIISLITVFYYDFLLNSKYKSNEHWPIYGIECALKCSILQIQTIAMITYRVIWNRFSCFSSIFFITSSPSVFQSKLKSNLLWQIMKWRINKFLNNFYKPERPRNVSIFDTFVDFVLWAQTTEFEERSMEKRFRAQYDESQCVCVNNDVWLQSKHLADRPMNKMHRTDNTDPFPLSRIWFIKKHKNYYQK